MFKRKYLATNWKDETVDDNVVTVVVALVDADEVGNVVVTVVNAVELQSIFEKLFSIIISNDLAYIGYFELHVLPTPAIYFICDVTWRITSCRSRRRRCEAAVNIWKIFLYNQMI